MENGVDTALQEKRKIRKFIRLISIQLKSCLTLSCIIIIFNNYFLSLFFNIYSYSVLLRKISNVTRSKKKAVTMQHKKKLINLQKQQHNYKEYKQAVSKECCI